MRRLWLWVILGFAAFLVLLAYTSIGLRKNRVEVCIEFNGHTSCRIASAGTPEQSRRTATENACALIASGVGDTIACQNKTPLSVKYLDRQ